MSTVWLKSSLLYCRVFALLTAALIALMSLGGQADAGQWQASAQVSPTATLIPRASISGASIPSASIPGVSIRTASGPRSSFPNPLTLKAKIAPAVETCDEALTRAEERYATPKGLLTAIAKVETGRKDTRTGVVTPWPWSANADNISYYFPTRSEAVAWVRDQQARGTASIDVGCMQVNLFYHRQAFGSVEEAFDPTHNADYAARFLVHLCEETGSWQQAIGFYHSRTTELATVYRRQVAAAFTRSVTVVRESLLARVRLAWSATLPTIGQLQKSKTSTATVAVVDHQEPMNATSNDVPTDKGTCQKSGNLLALTTFGQGG